MESNRPPASVSLTIDEAAARLRACAAGRREYAAKCSTDVAALLNEEAGLLERAARIVEGDLQPLYGLLPSWRWSDEMVAAVGTTKT